MKTIYIVQRWIDYSGWDNPIKAFTSEVKAKEFIEEIREKIIVVKI